MERHRLFDMGWDYDYDRAKRRLGCCKYGPKLLTFSLPFIDINPLDIMVNTIRHEIAHALVEPTSGHGIVWQRKAIEIGARPERCASDPNIKRPVGPYVFLCDCGPTYFHRNDRLHQNCKCSVCHVTSTVIHTPKTTPKFERNIAPVVFK
jgi:hypothetical protein